MSQLLSKRNLHVNDNQHFGRDKRDERDDNFHSLVIDDQKQYTVSLDSSQQVNKIVRANNEVNCT